jgi:hypothetical protein
MGGMALGAWLASRWSTRLQSLLRAYGWIEGLVGIAALAFHEMFVAATVSAAILPRWAPSGSRSAPAAGVPC